MIRRTLLIFAGNVVVFMLLRLAFLAAFRPSPAAHDLLARSTSA